MKRICAWCGKDMGDIPPYEDKGVTHCMCEECYKKERKGHKPVEINGNYYYRTLEVCHQTGISRTTLFRWLKQGIIEGPCRDRRGWKLFSEDDVNKIKAEATRVIVWGG